MKRRKAAQQFWLTIKDDDRKEFSVVGPLVDDTSWTEAVFRAQEGGRKVRCSSSPFEQSKEYIRRYWLEQGYKEAETPIVVPDESLR